MENELNTNVSELNDEELNEVSGGVGASTAYSHETKAGMNFAVAKNAVRAPQNKSTLAPTVTASTVFGQTPTARGRQNQSHFAMSAKKNAQAKRSADKKGFNRNKFRDEIK